MEGGILEDRILTTGVQTQIQEGKNKKPQVPLRVRIGIKHMLLSHPLPFLFINQK